MAWRGCLALKHVVVESTLVSFVTKIRLVDLLQDVTATAYLKILPLANPDYIQRNEALRSDDTCDELFESID